VAEGLTMTDRDRRRFGDPLHPPEYGGVAGELDSDERLGRDDPTPVGAASRRKPVEVDPSAFDVDPRWRDFDEMRDEVKACREERLSRSKRAKWLNPLRNIGIGTLIAALLWTVRALNQRGVDEEKARQRNEQVEQNTRDVRSLMDWRIAIDTLMGLRRTTVHEPPRNEP
jgi:hypothetical protein